MIKKLSREENFMEEVNKHEIVIVDFFADWCPPCKMMMPVLESLSEENPEVNIIKVNVEEHREDAAKYAILSIPTFLIMKNGIEVKRTIGVMSKHQLLEMVKEVSEN